MIEATSQRGSNVAWFSFVFREYTWQRKKQQWWESLTVSPLGPVVPWGPGSPLSPFSPCSPGGPIRPIIPGCPFSPLAPGSPRRPSKPGGPWERTTYAVNKTTQEAELHHHLSLAIIWVFNMMKLLSYKRSRRSLLASRAWRTLFTLEEKEGTIWSSLKFGHHGKYNIRNLQRRKMDNWPVQRHCNSDSLSPLTVVTLKYAINITEFNLFGLLYSALQST